MSRNVIPPVNTLVFVLIILTNMKHWYYRNKKGFTTNAA